MTSTRKKPEANFATGAGSDKDIMKRLERNRQTAPPHHPQRIVFGLPHNYGKYSHQMVNGSEEGRERRASPLFIHIHQALGSDPVASLIYLPSVFLPEGDRVNVGGHDVALNRADSFWEPIATFIDRFEHVSV